MALLFSGADVQVALKNVQGNAESEIASFSDDYVLGHPIEDLADSVYDKFAVKTPVLDKDNIGSDWVDGYVPEYRTPNPDFDQQPGVKGRIYSLHVPYTGDEYLFHYMPLPPPPNPAHATVSKTEVVFTAGGAWHTSESINQQFDANLATLEDGIARVAKNVTPFNAALRDVIVARLAHRIEIAKKTRQTTQGLKYPLRRLANAPETFKLPEKPKQLTPKPVKVDKSYILDEVDYQNILKICESMSLVMERSPSVFIGVGEEHIRVHYLVQLNGQYQGEATGETFNHIGDTDILIRHENKNVFVAECKFWGGYEAMKKTVDQLLGYTTWRDTRTALIIFNRNLDFTNVISEAQRAMKDHQHYKSGPTNESETRLRYIFSHPEDKQRDIIVTLLLYNMPRPVKP
ncbi:hypothetical protein [Bradyrhizobium sp. AUGA SZCCT0431]|uniref:hypothetical protein n=1 Tax=Bradyrhizobium sp. AUGA SZCCT0431 TaxID=2807674 RepID=UPI001BAB895D|nr:hypothetical protein [Bradyrhizobium sp. AUGA SZCCT0431]MBR1143342.1 hypothetical protein [Bradyrhizobium sp. AUGA SZCCT0431]